MSAFVMGLLLVNFINGCATLQREDGLDAALVNIRLEQVTPFEATALFTLRISNERPEPLTIDGSVHKFYLNGAYVGKGLSDQTVHIPRLSSTTCNVPVHFRTVALATRFRSLLESQALDWRTSSTFYLPTTGFRPGRCRIENQGRLAFEDFQPKRRLQVTPQ
jgi:LEA14-like dessication related protein